MIGLLFIAVLLVFDAFVYRRIGSPYRWENGTLSAPRRDPEYHHRCARVTPEGRWAWREEVLHSESGIGVIVFVVVSSRSDSWSDSARSSAPLRERSWHMCATRRYHRR